MDRLRWEATSKIIKTCFHIVVLINEFVKIMGTKLIKFENFGFIFGIKDSNLRKKSYKIQRYQFKLGVGFYISI